MGLVMVNGPNMERRKRQGVEDGGVEAKKTIVYLVLTGVIQTVLKGLVMKMVVGEGIGTEVDMAGETWEEMAGQVVEVMVAEIWIQMGEGEDLEVHMTEDRYVTLLFVNYFQIVTALFHHTGYHRGGVQVEEEVEMGKYHVTLALPTGPHYGIYHYASDLSDEAAKVWKWD